MSMSTVSLLVCGTLKADWGGKEGGGREEVLQVVTDKPSLLMLLKLVHWTTEMSSLFCNYLSNFCLPY